jgi:hypothetical protein
VRRGNEASCDPDKERHKKGRSYHGSSVPPCSAPRGPRTRGDARRKEGTSGTRARAFRDPWEGSPEKRERSPFMDEQKNLTVLDYLEIVLRRKWLILIPFLLSATVAVYLCATLPPIYRSTTTILVEPQQVPENPCRSLRCAQGCHRPRADL